MIIRTDIEQNSLDWLMARAGVVTASEFSQFLTTDFEIRKGEMVRSFVATKVAERWLGGPLPGFGMTLDMDAGRFRESEAIPFAELELGCEIQRVGFITDDSGKVGASPDGLIGNMSGIEIKCPDPKSQVKYLLASELPPDYAPQVHGSMHVTGYKSWTFMSYRRGFPALILNIKRDEEIQEKIRVAVAAVLEQIDAAYAKIVKANNGPPKRATIKPQPTETIASLYRDLDRMEGEIVP